MEIKQFLHPTNLVRFNFENNFSIRDNFIKIRQFIYYKTP